MKLDAGSFRNPPFSVVTIESVIAPLPVKFICETAVGSQVLVVELNTYTEPLLGAVLESKYPLNLFAFQMGAVVSAAIDKVVTPLTVVVVTPIPLLALPTILKLPNWLLMVVTPLLKVPKVTHWSTPLSF